MRDLCSRCEGYGVDFYFVSSRVVIVLWLTLACCVETMYKVRSVNFIHVCLVVNNNFYYSLFQGLPLARERLKTIKSLAVAQEREFQGKEATLSLCLYALTAVTGC